MANVFQSVLGAILKDDTKYKARTLLFDKIIGFKGIVDGVGCSSIVHNVAHYLAEREKMLTLVVDTHMVYPVVGTLMHNKLMKNDLLEYQEGHIREILYNTQYSKVYYAGMQNRTYVDMLSDRDNEQVIVNFLNAAKELFDVILIDLSNEPTTISTYAALQCDRVYPIITPDASCLSNTIKAFLQMKTLAVPSSVCDKVIVNKTLPEVNSNFAATLQELNMQQLVSIPFSKDVYRELALGKTLVTRGIMAGNKIQTFADAMQVICDDIVRGSNISANNVTPDNFGGTPVNLQKDVAEDDIELDI